MAHDLLNDTATEGDDELLQRVEEALEDKDAPLSPLVVRLARSGIRHSNDPECLEIHRSLEREASFPFNKDQAKDGEK